MEDELVKERSNLARFLANQKEIGRQVARHQERVAEWQGKAELALSKEREDLARAALIEKKKQAELADSLLREQQAVDSGIEKLGRRSVSWKPSWKMPVPARRRWPFAPKRPAAVSTCRARLPVATAVRW